MLAIIGGSGLSKLGKMEAVRTKTRTTPYGEPSAPLAFGRLGGSEIVFLPRHGEGHTFAPHQVNYRANLWALKDAGAHSVVAVATAGGIREGLGPGALLVPSQIIDYTWGRPATFFEGVGVPVTHVDFTEPYSAAVRERLRNAAAACGERVADGGVYAATQGPRLESAAEIDRLERDGADVVGMTGMPETGLARELGLEYAALVAVVNYAAGRGDSRHAVALSELGKVVEETMRRVCRILEELCRR